MKIDYFATSLPNFLLFEDDVQERNQLDSLFVLALASLGLGEFADAEGTSAAGLGKGHQPSVRAG